MASFVRALMRADRPAIEIALVGPAGAGKRTLATQLCAELQLPLLIADAGRLMGPGVDPGGRRGGDDPGDSDRSPDAAPASTGTTPTWHCPVPGATPRDG